LLGDDDRRLTFLGALRSSEYWLLLVGCISAVAGIGVWVVVPLLVAGLSISALPKYLALWPKARRVGAEREWWQTVILSIFNCLAASYGAFMLGTVARWIGW
jgi:hypothetical protein